MAQARWMVAGVALGAAAAAWSASVMADATPEAIRKQMDTAVHLIEDSSAAKRIDTSGNAQAQAIRDEARALYRRAGEALDAGRAGDAEKLLAEAKKTMLRAVQAAGAGTARSDKAKQDFDSRALSVRALLKAQDRVADEKHVGAEATRLHDRVEALLAEADALRAKGDYAAGKAKLDVAYDELKTSIERMRGGEVLEHKIVFNSVEDEYGYYRDKTASQLEAIEMAAGSAAGTSKEKMIAAFADKMRAARAEAGTLAGRGDYAAAVKVLEPVFKSAPYQLMSLLR